MRNYNRFTVKKESCQPSDTLNKIHCNGRNYSNVWHFTGFFMRYDNDTTEYCWRKTNKKATNLHLYIYYREVIYNLYICMHVCVFECGILYRRGKKCTTKAKCPSKHAYRINKTYFYTFPQLHFAVLIHM